MSHLGAFNSYLFYLIYTNHCKGGCHLLSYFSMATCYVCHKGKLKGHKVSHSAIKTRRFFKPNLHVLSVKFTADNNIKQVKICSKCYKKIKNDFWAGKTLPFVPVSLTNQQKLKSKTVKVEPNKNGQEKGTKN